MDKGYYSSAHRARVHAMHRRQWKKDNLWPLSALAIVLALWLTASTLEYRAIQLQQETQRMNNCEPLSNADGQSWLECDKRGTELELNTGLDEQDITSQI